MSFILLTNAVADIYAPEVKSTTPGYGDKTRKLIAADAEIALWAATSEEVGEFYAATGARIEMRAQVQAVVPITDRCVLDIKSGSIPARYEVVTHTPPFNGVLEDSGWLLNLARV